MGEVRPKRFRTPIESIQEKQIIKSYKIIHHFHVNILQSV